MLSRHDSYSCGVALGAVGFHEASSTARGVTGCISGACRWLAQFGRVLYSSAVTVAGRAQSGTTYQAMSRQQLGMARFSCTMVAGCVCMCQSSGHAQQQERRVAAGQLQQQLSLLAAGLGRSGFT